MFLSVSPNHSGVATQRIHAEANTPIPLKPICVAGLLLQRGDQRSKHNICKQFAALGKLFHFASVGTLNSVNASQVK